MKIKMEGSNSTTDFEDKKTKIFSAESFAHVT